MRTRNRSGHRKLAALVVASLIGSVTLFTAMPAGAAARPYLRLGSSGAAVLTLEQRLVTLGYTVHSVDNYFGADTRTAVVELQTNARIGRDGIVGPITWGALDRGVAKPDPTPPTTPTPAPTPPPTAGPRPMLRLGSSGAAVLTLEQRLVTLGYTVHSVDNYFGADTRTAVVELQTNARIGRDGIVGPITWSALDRGVTKPDPTPPPPAPTPAPTPTPQPTPPTPTPTPVPAPDPGSGRALLRQGSSGPEVLALEQRLSSLGYWVDEVDSTFGYGTRHAVTALQKAAGLSRDGIVGPATWAALDAGERPSARTNVGNLIEVDLTKQLLLVVNNGSVVEVHDTSTGRVSGWTPVGTWTVTRQIDGYRYAPLGVLYRPKYFYRGVAIHGYPSVPASPASHGCVRLTNASMDHVWSSGSAPVGTTIKVYR